MKIEVLTSPYSKGASTGDGGGPATLLHAGLLESLRAEGYEVAGPFMARAGADALGDEMAVIETAGRSLAQHVREARSHGALCLVLEGDCTAAPAVVAGLDGAGRTGLLWIDSHGDFNTPDTTPSGMLGGMPVAVATARCFAAWQEAVGLTTPLRDDDIVLAGIRDLDPPERAALEASHVEVIEALGQPHKEGARLAEAVARITGGIDALYVHVDVDVLNPDCAQGFTMPVPGGPVAEDLAEMVALAARGGKLAALGIAAFNPARDTDGRTTRAILHCIHAACGAVPQSVSAAG